MMRRFWWLAFVLVMFAHGGAARAAWYEAKSKHFIIYADHDPEKLRDFAVRLEKFDTAVRLVRGADDPPIGDGLRLTIFFLDDTDDVARLAGRRGSNVAGFYIPRASGSVAFVPRRVGDGREWEVDAEIVFFHEYAHHLMFQNLDASYPEWVSEGFAEFFSTADIQKDGSVRLGSPANHRALGLFHLSKPPLDEILAGTFQRKTGADSEGLYGRGWLMTHYLTFSEPRKGQQAKYLSGIRSGLALLDSARAAFGDLRQLDRELDRYLNGKRFRYLTLSGAGVHVDPATVRVRPLRPGEAAVMPVRIRSKRGVNDKTAPDVAKMARAVAAKYPTDPAVQTALAEAEFDADNHREAAAAADRALAVDPNNAEALLYKGRALMAAAESGGSEADWKAIRALFSQANRLDPEDPEPLLLFYQSYGAARQRPSANAVEGLLYALLLAPQDMQVRHLSVFQLLHDNRLPEARNALAPIAFNPHLDEDSRARARQAVTALDSGNREEALRLLASELSPSGGN